MFSKTCEYGIRAVIYISAKGSQESKIGIPDIGKNIEAPVQFTAKILQTLVHNDIVSSQKGVNGGFYLNKQQKQKQLIEVVRAIDGDKMFSGCGLGLKSCSEKEPCPLHDKFKAIRSSLKKMMEQTTIDEMSKTLKIGRVLLRIEQFVKHEE
ncbi:MAG: Rrf2 family transcriptional regulator [Bacteroidetes bacterium]|nr:Rrf2 family transcriptional regulator [Bacteroidota bacterium]